MSTLKNHNALIATPEVKEICRPLKKLGVDFFCYHRIFLDGSEIMLSNDGNWAEYYYNIDCSMYLDIKYAVEQQFEYFIWPYTHDDSEVLERVRGIANIFYGLTFIDAHLNDPKEYWEIFGFALDAKFDLNFILNQMSLLKQFCGYFQTQATHLIASCHQDRIIPLKKNLTIFDEKALLSELNNETNQFLKEIGLESRKPAWMLTSRELQCIQHLLLGQTANQTAKSLNISVRTVESHLENIKSKLHCKKKSELIAHLIKMGFSPSAQLLQL